MRTQLCSAIVVLAAMTQTGCVSMNMEKGCGVDEVPATTECCGPNRLGGLLGRFRGEQPCVDCGSQNGCADGNCGAAAGNGSNGMAMGSGVFGGMGARGMVARGMGARGMGARGMGARGMNGQGMGTGGMGTGGMGAGGMGARGMAGGKGFLAGGFGGACGTCGLRGGRCGCGLSNQAPHTEHPFAGPHGPATGHVGYPYYTTRAPRDFFMANPPSIGR